MHMSLFRDATFMMQMPHAGVQMQSLSMMVPVHIFNRDADVSLQRWRCKNLVVQMSSNGYVMMQIFLQGCRDVNVPLQGCHDANVPLQVCHDANVPLQVCNDADVSLRVCRDASVPLQVQNDANAPLWVCRDMNALMQTHFIQKFRLFLKRGFLSAYQNLIYYS